MLAFLDPFRGISFAAVILKLVVTTVCAGSIGLERGQRGRAAGFRTHIIVALGAALVMITNQYMVTYINPNSDPARLGAQVINGIGFLGAGTIMVTSKSKVQGLTTAAGLWASACMGLAAGIGFYEVAVIASLFILFTMTIMQRVETSLSTYTTPMLLRVELSSSEAVPQLIEEVNKLGATIKNIEVRNADSQAKSPENSVVLLRLAVGKKGDSSDYITLLNSQIDAVSIEEV